MLAYSLRALPIVISLAIAAPVGLRAMSPYVSVPKLYKDGCSGGMSWFHRNVLGKPPAWEACCDAHDRVYARGGTADQRAAADKGLHACVAATGHRLVASFMWGIVRVAGQPDFRSAYLSPSGGPLLTAGCEAIKDRFALSGPVLRRLSTSQGGNWSRRV